MSFMYKNPLTKTYQYEYALYKTVADLFDSVVIKSRLIDSLKLYFAELPGGPVDEARTLGDAEADQASAKTRSKSDFLREVNLLVQKDVIGHVDFPMMHICSAEVRTVLEEDGTHTFVFSDGIYRFSVHIDVPRKGHPRRIAVNGHDGKKASADNPGTPRKGARYVNISEIPSTLAENRQK